MCPTGLHSSRYSLHHERHSRVWKNSFTRFSMFWSDKDVQNSWIKNRYVFVSFASASRLGLGLLRTWGTQASQVATKSFIHDTWKYLSSKFCTNIYQFCCRSGSCCRFLLLSMFVFFFFFAISWGLSLNLFLSPRARWRSGHFNKGVFLLTHAYSLPLAPSPFLVFFLLPFPYFPVYFLCDCGL